MIILGWIIFGAFTGWLASIFTGRGNHGCMVNIALGLVGAVVGGFLLKTLTGRPFTYELHSLLIQMLVAVIGAVVVILIWNALSGRR
jgi:uncharacterized membrane protein YeaQ/YmgE (transglycosylase-associated protein family)